MTYESEIRKDPVRSEIVSAQAEADKQLGIITKRIGIVSSTTFDRTYVQKAFNAGVNDASVGYTVLEQPGRYDFPSLKKAIKTLDTDIADPPLELIVTVGGLIVANAALAIVTQKPFLSIVGGVGPNFPQTSQGFFFGGVNLQAFGQNAARVKYLVNNKGKLDKNICLVCNPNSHMAGLETFAWQHATPKRGPIIAAGRDPVTGTNDSSTYTGAFLTAASAALGELGRRHGLPRSTRQPSRTRRSGRHRSRFGSG
jgi:hypothetical protein